MCVGVAARVLVGGSDAVGVFPDIDKVVVTVSVGVAVELNPHIASSVDSWYQVGLDWEDVLVSGLASIPSPNMCPPTFHVESIRDALLY